MSSSRCSEATPLLSRDDNEVEQTRNDDERQDDQHNTHAASSLMRSLLDTATTKKNVKRRWPSLVALLILCVIAILIMVFGFFTPRVVEEYAMQASTFEPTRLSIDSITDSGVKARVQGDFYMDASKVNNTAVRNLGRFATWVARKAETKKTRVEVRLPEYGDDIIGSAILPAIKVNLRNRKKTEIDILSDVEPGSKSVLKDVAKDWMKGKLDSLKVEGSAKVAVSSGIIHLSEQELSHTLLFKNGDAPALPKYNITRINVYEVELPDQMAMAADVSIALLNEYPVDFVVPPLAFDIMVKNCHPSNSYIHLAEVKTDSITVKSRQIIHVEASGIVRNLPDDFTEVCPDSQASPLDVLLARFIRGDGATVFVRGSSSPIGDTPHWVSDFLSAFTVPVPIASHALGDLVKDFSTTNTHFSLPPSYAKPGSPEANPRISTDLDVLVGIPKDVDVPVDIKRIRSRAHVYYKGDELGILDLEKWQKANSTRIDDLPDGPALEVHANIKNAPVEITDEGVFGSVVQELLFGSEAVFLKVQAQVDVQIETVLGELTVRKIPAEAVMPVKRGSLLRG
jgi:hypothetical protein